MLNYFNAWCSNFWCILMITYDWLAWLTCSYEWMLNDICPTECWHTHTATLMFVSSFSSSVFFLFIHLKENSLKNQKKQQYKYIFINDMISFYIYTHFLHFMLNFVIVSLLWMIILWLFHCGYPWLQIITHINKFFFLFP